METDFWKVGHAIADRRSTGYPLRFRRLEAMLTVGIIDSLSAGYRFVGRRLELLLVPILLDLLLWLAPSITLAPIFARLADFYNMAARVEEMPAEFGEMSSQVSTLITEMGNGSNLLHLLVSTTLLHVPSLLVFLEPVSYTGQIAVESPLAAVGLGLVFGIIGILIGAVYVNLLARQLPLGDGSKSHMPADFTRAALRHTGKIILFVIAVVAMLAVVYVPVSIAMALISLFSPALSSFFALLLGGFTMLLLLYLYFATVGIIMDDLSLWQAVQRSVWLVRTNFWSTLGFIVLTNVISLGMGLLLDNLVRALPAGKMVAIVAHAYIGTGLAMALLVFYRTRLLRMAEGGSRPPSL